jgi:hypothetical protein
LKPVKFADGSTHNISPAHASKVLDHYAGIAKPADKANFQAHIDKSHSNFKEMIKEDMRYTTVRQAINRIVSREIPTDAIFGLHEGYNSTRTVKKKTAGQRLLEIVKESASNTEFIRADDKNDIMHSSDKRTAKFAKAYADHISGGQSISKDHVTKNEEPRQGMSETHTYTNRDGHKFEVSKVKSRYGQNNKTGHYISYKGKSY